MKPTQVVTAASVFDQSEMFSPSVFFLIQFPELVQTNTSPAFVFLNEQALWITLSSTYSQVVSFVSSMVDWQLEAQVVDVGICSMLQQDVDAVWIPRTCSVVQNAVAIWRLGVYISAYNVKAEKI